MICWIKRMQDWSHVDRPSVLSWDVPLWSSGTDTGTVTVAGEMDGINGDWLIIEGRPYVIKSAAPKNGATSITVQLPENAFARTLRYTGTGTERYGPFIAAVLASEFVAQADAQYALPYLSVSESDTTIFAFPVAPGETYTLLDVIRQAAEAGVYCSWAVGAAGLSVSVARREAAAHNVFFSGGSAQLSSQTYTNAIVAKATVRQIREDKSTGTITVLDTGVYYWQPDGTVNDEPPDPRVQGDWVLVDVDENTDLLTGAVSAMARNTAAYKVEFFSDRTYQLGDVLTLRIGKIVTRAVLSCARRKSGDSRTLYRAGTAAVTLTDKIAQGTGARTVSGGSGSGTPGAPGVTFTPAVSAAGVISWTNDGGLPNPDPVNIKGPQGEQGPQGEDGATGAQGPQGDSGVYYGTDTPPAGTKVWIDPSGSADPVLPEEGENYIKFPNGTLICWGYYYGGTMAASAVGSLYRTAVAINAVFPVPFVDMPHVSASNHNGYGIVGEIDVSATGIQYIYLLRPNSGSIYPRIYWTAIGRWK